MSSLLSASLSSYSTTKQSSVSTCTSIGWLPRNQGNGNTTTPRVANEYTDTDLANDMNALSFTERQLIVEDIHGVSDSLEETPDFLESKVQEIIQTLKNMPRTSVRSAWDRAVFLRPSLASKDKDHYLLFLRARRFDAFLAANLLLKFYETKRELWGDDLLIHRISWNNLSLQEQAQIRRGVCQLTPKNTESGSRQHKRVWYARVALWENAVTNPDSLTKAITYPFMATIQDDVDFQREGCITILDIRGPLKCTGVQLLQYGVQAMRILDNMPDRTIAIHVLYSQQNALELVKVLQRYFARDRRIRFRLHSGSWMEIQYSLRTYGIVLSDSFEVDIGPHQSVFSQAAIQEDILHWTQMEANRKSMEAPFQDPSSMVALYPNPQDVIMGKNRKVAKTWPGNMNYETTIKEFTPRYLAAKDKKSKSVLSSELIHILQVEHKSRFLARRETWWEVVDNSEVQSRVGQSLREECKTLLKQMKQNFDYLK